MPENRLRLRIGKVHQVWGLVGEEPGPGRVLVQGRVLGQGPEVVGEWAPEPAMVLAWVLGLFAPDNRPVLRQPSVKAR